MTLAILAFVLCVIFLILAIVLVSHRTTLLIVAAVFLVLAVGLMLFARDVKLGGDIPRIVAALTDAASVTMFGG